MGFLAKVGFSDFLPTSIEEIYFPLSLRAVLVTRRWIKSTQESDQAVEPCESGGYSKNHWVSHQNSRSGSCEPCAATPTLSAETCMTALKIDVPFVLQVAAQAFAQQGFDGVSMRDIAKASNTSATALHYHFGTKEDLFQEACDFEYEAFIDAVQKRLVAYSPETLRPEMLAGAMFDEWTVHSATLLLTDRDVIDALVAPDRWLTASHYPRVLKLIKETHSRLLGREISHDEAFGFAAMLFGYCSLMNIDRRYAIKAPSDVEYLQGKRAQLIRLAANFWEISSSSMSSTDFAP